MKMNGLKMTIFSFHKYMKQKSAQYQKVLSTENEFNLFEF